MSTTTDGFERVASLDALEDGGVMGVMLQDGTPVCLVRRGSEVFAMKDYCSHQNFPMSSGELREDGTLECAWHGARFALPNGLPVKGPACEPLVMYAIRMEGDDILVSRRKPA